VKNIIKTMVKNSKQNYIYAVGRRKSASARVRLYLGKGDTTVNGKLISDYFPGKINQEFWSRPFRLVDALDKYYATVKVVGGGLRGQLDAVVLGISRALAKANKEEFHPILRKAGLLTRDSRVRERRKVGTGGKARREKQSPKR